MAFKSKEEQARYHREVWYPKNKERRIELNKTWKDSVRKRISEYKVSKGCIDCGYNAHAAALDFDHTELDKDYSISNGVTRSYSFERIMNEISKCEVRCANCHRIKTFERRQ